MKISLLLYMQADIRNSYWTTVINNQSAEKLYISCFAALQIWSFALSFFFLKVKVDVPNPDLCVILQGFFMVWINSRDLEPWRKKYIWEPLRKVLRSVLLSWMWSRALPKSPQERQKWLQHLTRETANLICTCQPAALRKLVTI